MSLLSTIIQKPPEDMPENLKRQTRQRMIITYLLTIPVAFLALLSLSISNWIIIAIFLVWPVLALTWRCWPQYKFYSVSEDAESGA